MDLETAFDLLSYLSSLSSLIPLIASIVKNKTLNSSLRVLFLYLLVSFITELISTIFAKNGNGIRNYIIQNIFTMLECGLIAGIYYQHFTSKQSKIMVTIALIFILTVALIRFGLLEEINKRDAVINTLESCFFIILAYLYFNKLMFELNITSLGDYYFFWLNSAFLIYFSGAFFLFLFNDFLITCDLQRFYLLYSLHLIINIAYNTLLAIGVCKIKQPLKY